VTDDADEEDGQGGEEDHLEYGVDSDEDGTVFIVAACETVPNEDLEGKALSVLLVNVWM
jgi:hypothetical protein